MSTESEDWTFTFSYQPETETPLPEGIQVFRSLRQQSQPFQPESENDNADSIVSDLSYFGGFLVLNE